jgi:hypothetical protein
VRVDHGCDAADRPRALESVTLVRDHQAEDAVVVQDGVAILQEGDEIGDVLDHMRRDDPVVMVGLARDLGKVLDRVDVEPLGLRRDRVVARA